MTLEELSPFVRFAARMGYEQSYNRKTVQVTDCRLFFILEGTGELDVGGRQYALMPDSLFYCCAGSRYTVHTEKGFSLISLNFDLSRQWSRDTAPFSPVREPEQWAAMPVYRSAVTNSPFLNGYLFLENVGDLRSLAQSAVEEFSTGDRFAQLLCAAQLKLLLLRLHRLEQPQLPPKIDRVRSYIQKHYAQPLTNGQLAGLVGYHPYHLNRLYTACTGVSLHSELSRVRLSRASDLILNTDCPLQDIPEQVGFTSYPHFSASFKRAFGCSPAQYRKRLKGSI